ncbi:patatin-like phospholipase family protein [Granulosicoccus sp. 3-233]|uniref:patatin-like phospholipase family protein n=1 Tax=Granulosicoccus sp. 3-233 TaxID=3417969 RepID=UPI003D334B73
MSSVSPRAPDASGSMAICRGTAIVAEGGGQRGIYTAGVLDAFLGAGFNPFEVAVGTSAGAQNLSSYMVGLPGYAKRAIAELSVTPSFMVPYRWLGKRGVLDLDMYFSRVLEDPDYRFPCGEVDRLAGRRRLVIVATSRSDLSARYLEPDSDTLLTYMKASSAIPFLYKGGVPVGGDILVDGGVADPLPVRKAHSLGAKRILVIRTVPAEDMNSSWRQRLKILGLHRAMPGTMSEMLARHEQAYEEAMRFINRPPTGVEVVQIAPESPLRSHVIGSSSDALMADHECGCRAGEVMLEPLRDWFDRTSEGESSRTGTVCRESKQSDVPAV